MLIYLFVREKTDILSFIAFPKVSIQLSTP